ncbi:hypothetical protein JYU34_007203 [Plutella xylostella]|uniref:Uncharacterized protein n=1 Tax=Plutella xylostella TaxID=51655 RepID=A0ABQ7QPV1_PLUXY|nr:hypothetical protein JYU34_007203 [Plutella xylostella]
MAYSALRVSTHAISQRNGVSECLRLLTHHGAAHKGTSTVERSPPSPERVDGDPALTWRWRTLRNHSLIISTTVKLLAATLRLHAGRRTPRGGGARRQVARHGLQQDAINQSHEMRLFSRSSPPPAPPRPAAPLLSHNGTPVQGEGGPA